MRLTNAEIEVLRTRPQQTTLYLSIFQPQVVFRAKVNDASIAKGARVITYDNASGSHLNIEANFLMYVGTSVGESDVGKIRVRSATASQITVSENSGIDWQDNQDLTVLKYIRLDPIFPRIVANPANEADSIFYKDWDVSYTNQNTILGTFACAGPHRALFKGEHAYYSNTGSYNVAGVGFTHHWEFEGGSPSTSSLSTPGFVLYNTPGHYVTKYTVSGTNGSVDSTYRYVSVYDREGEGSNAPITKWELLSLGGSRDEGGYKANFRVRENVPITENAVVVLFSENWYGNTRVSLGGNYPNAEKIFWVGYVLDGSIRHNYEQSSVEFSAGSLSEVMKQALGFSVSVESKATPTRWYELYDLDCRRAIYHYLKWHTTALQIADFQFVGDDRKIQFFDADRTSMFDAIDNLMRGTLVGQCVTDRQGKMWMEVEAMAHETPTADFPAIMTISRRDWMNEPTIDERLTDELSFLEMGGIAYSGVVTGTFAALLGSAPGNAPGFRGTVETHEGLALLGQDQLNALVGNVYANRNSPYPNITMEMGILATNFDIAPQETVQMNILSTDTVRGIAIDGEYIPSGMEWSFSPQEQILLPRIDFRELVDGIEGETIIVPVSDTGNGFEVPPVQIPPLPPLTIPAFTIPTGSISAVVTTNIVSYMNMFVDVGWHDNTFYSVANGINIVSSSRAIGVGTPKIRVDDAADGVYWIYGQAMIEGAGLAAGSIVSSRLSLIVVGIQTAIAENRKEVDSDGGVVMSTSVNMIARITSGSVIELTLGGGIGLLDPPDEFALGMVRISA